MKWHNPLGAVAFRALHQKPGYAMQRDALDGPADMNRSCKKINIACAQRADLPNAKPRVQRQHTRQLLFLGNIVRFSIDRLVLCLSVRQAHKDIPRLPAAVFPVINVLSVFRQVLHLSFLPES